MLLARYARCAAIIHTRTAVVDERIVRKQVIKVNRIIAFSSINMFSNNIQETSSQGYKTQNENSTFSWVSSIGLWTTWPRSYAFRLA